MIFLTIGFQEPFDRLIKAMDELALSLNVEVIAQTSKTSAKPKHMKCVEFIKPVEFERYIASAKLVVAHAGMGTIISALEAGTPIIVMPRLVKFKEVITDHQLATAESLDRLKYVNVAYNEMELKIKVPQIYNDHLKPLYKIGKSPSPELSASLQSFIDS